MTAFGELAFEKGMDLL